MFLNCQILFYVQLSCLLKFERKLLKNSKGQVFLLLDEVEVEQKVVGISLPVVTLGDRQRWRDTIT